jgi:hypothetical protein
MNWRHKDILALVGGEIGLPVELDDGLGPNQYGFIHSEDGSKVVGFRVSRATPFESSVAIRAFAEFEARWWGRLVRAVPWVSQAAYRMVMRSTARRYAAELGSGGRSPVPGGR